MLLTQYIKVFKQAFKSWISYFLYQTNRLITKDKKSAAIYDIPLGYGSQKDIPLKKINARDFDVFFAGSILHNLPSRKNLNGLLKSHKAISREQMLAVVHDISCRHPDWKIKLGIRDTYDESSDLDVNDGYSENLMNSKICLVPRGVTLDTCRFFEALRYGCIIITDSLPKTWFYEDAPVYKVDSWIELEDILLNLLSDKEKIEEMHQSTISFWREKCSEEAVASFMFHKLSSL